MPRNAFSDSFAKLQRANELLGLLHDEIDAFRESRPLTFEAEIDPNPPRQGANLIRVRSRDSYLLAKRMERFGILAGEVAHHCRSALNHLVWHLIRRGGGKPSSRTEFPIFRSKVRYAVEAPKKLAGVPEESLDAFLEVQPFNRDGTQDALWQVHTLDITDKHHVLLVATGVLPVRLEDEENAPQDRFYDLRDGDTIDGLWTRDPAGTQVEAIMAVALGEDPEERMTLESRLFDCHGATEDVVRTFRERF